MRIYARLILTMIIAVPAPAGSALEISRYTIDGGGKRSTGAGYVLTGSIGQPEADPSAASGGDFIVNGGFVVRSTVSGEGTLFANGFESGVP